jgi:ribonuclease HI
MVVSGLNYATSAWYTRYLGKGLPMFMQKIIVPIERYAARVITNCFRTVSHEAACAEANLPTATRLEKRVWKFWIDVHTLPKDHLMWLCLGGSTDISLTATHRAPTTYMAKAFGGSRPDLETIEPFAIAQWQADTRTAVHISDDRELGAKQCLNAQRTELQLFTDASQRNGLIGYSALVWMEKETKKWVQRTIGRQDQVNVYIAELAAIMEAVKVTAAMLARPNLWRRATIYSDSKTALQAIANPKLQSGQRLLRRIHEAIRLSHVQGRDIQISWIPGHYDIAGNEKAHQLAAETTEPEAAVTPVPWLDACYKSAVLGRPPDTGLKTRLNQSWTTSRHLRQVDAALPGRHVRMLYDTLTRREAQTLA